MVFRGMARPNYAERVALGRSATAVQETIAQVKL